MWAFLAAAVLTWTPPSFNTDGTPLTDLASYEVWHGCQQSGVYDTVEIVLAPASGHAVINLPEQGTCYFAAKATNSLGESSDFSNETSKLMASLAVPGLVTDIVITWQESQQAVFEFGILNIGELVYTNRSTVFTGIPGRLIGLPYIRPADDAVTKNNGISFTIDVAATIFVSLDVNRTNLPTWLNSFAARNPNLSATHTTFDIFSKGFPIGVVVLGDNGDAQSMYTVAIE